jgi:hypothetical protein
MKKMVLSIAILCLAIILAILIGLTFLGIKNLKPSAVTGATPLAAINIPRNLGECFFQLNAGWPKQRLEIFKNTKEDEIPEYNLRIGGRLRIYWALDHQSRLAQYFNKLGVFNPEDMTRIILLSYYRYLNGKDIRLNEQLRK